MIDEEKNILKEQPTKKSIDDEPTSATPEHNQEDGEEATVHDEDDIAEVSPDELTVEQLIDKLAAAEALAAGANHIVIGRYVNQAANPRAALDAVISSLEG